MPDDPLAGREIQVLNNMLAKLIPLAQSGDQKAMDRVIKILQLKQQYYHAQTKECLWD